MKPINIIIVFCLAFIIVSPILGGESLFNILDYKAVDKEIFWQIRLPRSLLGFFVGASLGLAGAIFQTIFKNPLASPYTLGVSSAASFGASLALLLGWQSGVMFSAVLFSVLASCILLTYRGNSNNLLLLGVASGLLFSSASIFISYLCDPMQSYQLTRWLMGGLDLSTYSQILFLALALSFTFLFCYLKSAHLDLILTGQDLAISRGLDVLNFKRKIVFIISLLIGVVTSLAGPIGFVGILVPHFCRVFGVVEHNRLTPTSAVLAGGLLVFCDYLARTLIYPAEIPVGVITSLIGAPIFIFVLLRKNTTIA